MAVIICSECGGYYNDSIAACPHCGYVDPSIIRCPECGGVITEDEPYCRSCGASIRNGGYQASLISVPGNIPTTPVQQMPMQQMPVQSMPVQPSPVQDAVPPVISPMSVPTETTPAKANNTNTNARTKTKTFITVINIYALISMIPTTIIMTGKIFALKAGNTELPFGISDFSDINAKLYEFFNFTGLSDKLTTVTQILGLLKYIWYASIFIMACYFLVGLFNVGKGKLLKFGLYLPITYLIITFIFRIIMNVFFLNKINDILPSSIKVSIEHSQNFNSSMLFFIFASIILNIICYDIPSNRSE